LQFGESAPALLDDYSVPYLFQEDFFYVLDYDQRPAFRWLIIGPERSGASWHVDPGLTSAWNTLLCGRKRSESLLFQLYIITLVVIPAPLFLFLVILFLVIEWVGTKPVNSSTNVTLRP
jgi:hypothetical protein